VTIKTRLASESFIVSAMIPTTLLLVATVCLLNMRLASASIYPTKPIQGTTYTVDQCDLIEWKNTRQAPRCEGPVVIDLHVADDRMPATDVRPSLLAFLILLIRPQVVCRDCWKVQPQRQGSRVLSTRQSTLSWFRIVRSFVSWAILRN